ncbi:unnamed protein product [Cylindrotheca closterium]|uniref:Uncharacterized protein n=1 Tax=Cylindrotheca closterium TaxID=2856 RepID=A0AAD2JKV1_9STRA|nr:unnamed protein product [Cylindrotheca closterium]
MSKRTTGKGPRAQSVSKNDSYHAPVSLVQKEWGKVDKICPFDASAFLGLLDDDDSDKIADDDEDNKTPYSQKANWDSYYISSYPVPQGTCMELVFLAYFARVEYLVEIELSGTPGKCSDRVFS